TDGDDEDNDIDTDAYALRQLSVRSRPLLLAATRSRDCDSAVPAFSDGYGPPRASGDEALPPTWCRGTLIIVYTPVATTSTHHGSPILIPSPFRHFNGHPSRQPAAIRGPLHPPAARIPTRQTTPAE
ncbi:hypothetical protein V497_02419, partial [Pseudogymnoascus sp. VKM F-4516 (FW-969)]